VLDDKALYPKALLNSPVVFVVNASRPKAWFPNPVVFADKADLPKALL
jgi:hypothetical protein